MRVKVNRELVKGLYKVSFAVDGFSPEEIEQMSKFGIPFISMFRQIGPVAAAKTRTEVAITQVNPSIEAAFNSQDEALEYEHAVLDHMRQEMSVVRAKRDEFTATLDVHI